MHLPPAPALHRAHREAVAPRWRVLLSAVAVIGAAVAGLAVRASNAGAPAPAPTHSTPVVAAQLPRLTGVDSTGTLRVTMHLARAVAGHNAFTLSVADLTGRPVSPDAVELEFLFGGPGTLPGSALTLARTTATTFAAAGDNLVRAGHWIITAAVAVSATSYRAPMHLHIGDAPTVVDVAPVHGEPTLYTAHLPLGRTVQLYLDPDRAGSNDLHVTFFGARGQELPVTHPAARLVLPGGTATELTVRVLEPGHFVAAVVVAAGRVTISVVATDPSDGERIYADIPVSVATAP